MNGAPAVCRNIHHAPSTYSKPALCYPLHGLTPAAQQAWEVGAIPHSIPQRRKMKFTAIK